MISQEVTYDKNETNSVWSELNRHINYLAGITLITFLLGALTYRDHYSLLNNAYSHLGRVHTASGNSNILSLVIFDISLLLCSYVCFRMDRILKGHHNHWLFKLCGTGYLLMIAPCDVFGIVHMLGALFVIGALFFYVIFSLIRLIPDIGVRRFIIYQVLLQGSVLPYGFLYFMNQPSKHAAQKLAIIGLILALKLTVMEFRRASSQDEVHSIDSLH